jgi:TonB family protein
LKKSNGKTIKLLENGQLPTGGGKSAIMTSGNYSIATLWVTILRKDLLPNRFITPKWIIYIYIVKNVRYPDIAKDGGIQGTVYLQQTIEEDGKVSNVCVIKGAHYILDAESVRVINQIEQYEKPAYQNGSPITYYQYIPVKFNLR